MELIPAIDLKEGRCVRLYQGQRGAETQYSEDPVGMALTWEHRGASRLHLVDLDGAFEEPTQNKQIIKEIIDQVSIPCQVGGGLRSEQAVETLLDAGAAAAIVGTAGVEDPEWLGGLVDRFGPERIYAGVDCETGEVMVSGWEEASLLDRDRWLARLGKLGVETVIYTDIGRDGTQEGLNLQAIREILKKFDLSLIASGGVGKLNDITRLTRLDSEQLKGVIIGKALYEGSFTLEQALRQLEATKQELT